MKNLKVTRVILQFESFLVLMVIICGLTSSLSYAKSSALPEGFVYLSDFDPSIAQEMRYAGKHNFVGKPIPGYEVGKCILSQKAAEALVAVQKELREFSMSLKVYDCYRPQMAVDSFVKWAKDLDDLKMKNEFYPKVNKEHLFRDGYIASKSGHSRGSTVDLTVIPWPAPKQVEYRDGEKLTDCFLPEGERYKDNSLDFGTGYDCFDPLAHTGNVEVGPSQKRNRLMLKLVMEKNGFKNLDVEWWHFTLRQEPFPETYFKFPVK